MADVMYDTIIVGAGAAGLTAALYTARRAMKTLLVSQDVGGQAATTDEIENYPGVDFIAGPDLMNKFKSQAEKFGASFVFAEVIKIEKELDELGKPWFEVKTNTESFSGRTVILAFGLAHRHLGVPGEQEFGGKGVSYCATCDAPLFKNRSVAVVGGGNSAVDAALLLAKFCPKVYLIHRRNDFRAEAFLVQQLNQPNIELVLEAEVKEVKGDVRVKEVVVYDVNKPLETTSLAVEGLFVEVGFIANTKLIDGLVELDERRQVKVTPDGVTSEPGIFGAGDVTTLSYKQIVISAGSGATAALKAYEYLQKLMGFRGVTTDWGMTKKPVTIPAPTEAAKS